MMRVVFAFLMTATMSSATGLEASLRPVARSVPEPVIADSRPEPAVLRNAPSGSPEISSQAVSLSLRPLLRPRAIEQKAMSKRRELRRGSVCGDVDIQGETVGLVPGRIRGCGIKNAVRVTSVSGVALTQKSVMECSTAKAVKTWINKSAKPALRNQGGGLDKLRVAAHYACRTRNNRPGAKISEHGKGRAIDVSGFYLKDGSLITVLKGWNASRTSKALRQMHKGACGPFGTVLGPKADRYHQDHFHFDTARYRSGPYCR